jgi:hypothetical protein
MWSNIHVLLYELQVNWNASVNQKESFTILFTVKQTAVARCYFVIPWYVVPPLGGRFLLHCRKRIASATDGKCRPCWRRGQRKSIALLSQILWAQNMESSKKPQTDCYRLRCRCDVCPTNMELVQWLWWSNRCEGRWRKRPSVTIVSDVKEMVRTERRVSLKQI